MTSATSPANGGGAPWRCSFACSSSQYSTSKRSRLGERLPASSVSARSIASIVCSAMSRRDRRRRGRCGPTVRRPSSRSSTTRGAGSSIVSGSAAAGRVRARSRPRSRPRTRRTSRPTIGTRFVRMTWSGVIGPRVASVGEIVAATNARGPRRRRGRHDHRRAGHRRQLAAQRRRSPRRSRRRRRVGVAVGSVPRAAPARYSSACVTSSIIRS